MRRMKAILFNTFLGILWLFLTILQVRFMGTFAAANNMGVGTAIVLWLVGQCVILSPLLWIIWRDRSHGNAPQ